MSGLIPDDLTPYGYHRSRYIGRGQFASAYIVRPVNPVNGDKEDVEYVAKVVPLDHLGSNDRRLAQQEVELLRRLRHPNIVTYVDSFLVQASAGRGLPNQLAVVIVTEYCEGGDLRILIRLHTRKEPKELFDESLIMHWFGQMLLALQVVHRSKILHRDLKTSNLFLSKDQHTLKVGDFGISRVLDNTAEAATTVVGTPYYMSPEVCRSEPYRDKSDVWAVGCVLYELCMLRHPFESDSLLGLVYRIVSESYDPIPSTYSNELRDLVRLLLSKSADDRPNVDDILAGAYTSSFLPAELPEENRQRLSSGTISPVRDRMSSIESLGSSVSHGSGTEQTAASAKSKGPTGEVCIPEVPAGENLAEASSSATLLAGSATLQSVGPDSRSRNCPQKSVDPRDSGTAGDPAALGSKAGQQDSTARSSAAQGSEAQYVKERPTNLQIPDKRSGLELHEQPSPLSPSEASDVSMEEEERPADKQEPPKNQDLKTTSHFEDETVEEIGEV